VPDYVLRSRYHDAG